VIAFSFHEILSAFSPGGDDDDASPHDDDCGRKKDSRRDEVSFSNFLSVFLDPLIIDIDDDSTCG
jgi:hypothetical protein